MPIQIKRTGRAEYGQTMRMLVYGPPGSGKTLFGSTAKKPFYINCDAGMMTLAEHDIDYVDIADTVDLLEVFQFIRSGKHDYDTIVIDTLDELQKVIIADRLKKERHESMQLQDWGYVGEQMQKIVRAYRNLPYNVIFLCHSKSTSDSETGALIESPLLQGSISDQIAGFVDMAAYIFATTVKEGETTEVVRSLRFQPGPRFPHIKDRSNKMPPFYRLNLTTDVQDIHNLVFGRVNEIAESEVVGEIETEADRAPAPAVEQVSSGGSGGPARAASNRSKTAPKKEAPAPVTPFEPAPSTKPQPKVVDKTEPTLEEAVATVKETLTVKPSEEKKALPKCDECSIDVDDVDLVDLSKIRFRKVYCKKHFTAKSTK